jgi:hypothetical protein
MSSIAKNLIAKNLIGSLIALLLCVAQAALVASDTSAAGLQHWLAVSSADQTLDRPSPSAYHR